MIRFLRILVITLIVLAAVVYAGMWYSADKIVSRVEAVVTKAFIAGFGPSMTDQYGYNVKLHVWPPTAEITGLFINSPALNVDGDKLENCRLSVDKITCDLILILRDQKLKMLSVEGRKFTGRLSREGLTKRLMRTGGAISSLVVDQYGKKARLRGHFGNVNVMEITVLGDWAVDSRGVATLVNREYDNPDGPVPEGAIRLIEEQVNFDVRVQLLDEELTSDHVSFGPDGLEISAHG